MTFHVRLRDRGQTAACKTVPLRGAIRLGIQIAAPRDDHKSVSTTAMPVLVYTVWAFSSGLRDVCLVDGTSASIATVAVGAAIGTLTRLRSTQRAFQQQQHPGVGEI